ncbi:MAG: hypothetical protein LBK82_04370, partial [Planctomycetaceae bacterium]|nr:hypothetical protein [Planctomycetaceae bacterium]
REKRWVIYQKARWAIAPVDSALIPKRKAILFASVNFGSLSASTPTQPFSKRLPTSFSCLS